MCYGDGTFRDSFFESGLRCDRRERGWQKRRTGSADTAWAMSQENVEIVRRGFEAWNAGDMDALRELYDPGIIWRRPEGWPEPGPYVGSGGGHAPVRSSCARPGTPTALN